MRERMRGERERERESVDKIRDVKKKERKKEEMKNKTDLLT